jgi:hypothetical protein
MQVSLAVMQQAFAAKLFSTGTASFHFWHYFVFTVWKQIVIWKTEKKTVQKEEEER